MVSIRKTLLIALAGTILFASLVTAVWSYLESTHEVEELFDAELAQITRVLQGLLEPGADQNQLANLQETLRRFESLSQQRSANNGDDEFYAHLAGHKYESKIAFQLWRNQGAELVTAHPGLMPIPKNPQEGYDWIEADNHRWRTFTLFDPQRQLWIRAAQREDVRHELTGELGETITLPLLWMILILLVAIYTIITWGLWPLKQIERRVRALQPEQIKPLALQRAPKEVQGLVSSLNQLLVRLQETLEREKRFTADAAHELRTPLAALKLHLQNAMQQPQPNLQPLLNSVERMSHLVEQMLTLSRLDPQQKLLNPQPLDLRQVAETVLAEMAPLALSRHIEPILDAPDRCPMAGDPALLAVLLRNLVDNAIRYSPPESRVEVHLQVVTEGLRLEVLDQGPGIPEEDRERVMERFVRCEDSWESGSGLGLSIVARIVELHSAKLSFGTASGDRTGLRARVEFPKSVVLSV